MKDAQTVAEYSRHRKEILAEVEKKREQRRLQKDKRPIVWFVSFQKTPRHRKKRKNPDGGVVETKHEEKTFIGLGYMHIGGRSGSGNCHLKLATFENLERMRKYIVAYDIPDVEEVFESVKNRDTVTGYAVTATADEKKNYRKLLGYLNDKIKEIEGQFDIAERESNLEKRIKELEEREAKLTGKSAQAENSKATKGNKKSDTEDFEKLKGELNG